MSYALLSLVITLTVRHADSALIKHLQKAPVQHQGVQHHGTLLPRQQPACTNLLDATELHGEWVEGAPNMKVECPAWAQEIDCLDETLEVSAAVRAKARAEYSQVFQPHTCSLKAWDAAAFSQCIKGRRLIFIGDSTTRQQFQSLGCLLGDAIASEHAGLDWNASSITGGKDYMMPGNFGRLVTKSFWGDVQLRSGASLHARIIGSYNGDLLDDLLAELSPIEPSDMIVVNFGAWYPAFAWQGDSQVDSHLLDRFQRDMTDMLRRLRAHPAQILWRSYSPSHFGGEQGSFILDKKDQGREQQDKMECTATEKGETWYDDFIKSYLKSCGAKCSNIKFLPIFELSLSRHRSHIGPLQGKALNCEHCSWDCRHFCSNVLHTWNTVLFNSICA